MTQTNTTDADALLQRGLDLFAAGSPGEEARVLRALIETNLSNYEAYHGLVRALRDAGLREEPIAAALALTALSPNDLLAHTALSISLQHAGRVPEAESAAARARVLEWKIQLQSPAKEGT